VISFLNEVHMGKISGEWHSHPFTNNEDKKFEALGLSFDQAFVFPK